MSARRLPTLEYEIAVATLYEATALAILHAANGKTRVSTFIDCITRRASLEAVETVCLWWQRKLDREARHTLPFDDAHGVEVTLYP